MIFLKISFWIKKNFFVLNQNWCKFQQFSLNFFPANRLKDLFMNKFNTPEELLHTIKPQLCKKKGFEAGQQSTVSVMEYIPFNGRWLQMLSNFGSKFKTTNRLVLLAFEPFIVYQNVKNTL